MKSLKVLVFAGIVVIITSIICFTGREDVYNKKIHYNSPEEIISALNSSVLNASEKRKGYEEKLVNTDEFKECLSRRKRITGSGLDVISLNLQEDKSADEQKIIDDYKTELQRMHNYDVGDNLRACTLYGTYISLHEKKGDIKMDIVFIDEGEGYVIDYINSTYINGNGTKHDTQYIE